MLCIVLVGTLMAWLPATKAYIRKTHPVCFQQIKCSICPFFCFDTSPTCCSFYQTFGLLFENTLDVSIVCFLIQDCCVLVRIFIVDNPQNNNRKQCMFCKFDFLKLEKKWLSFTKILVLVNCSKVSTCKMFSSHGFRGDSINACYLRLLWSRLPAITIAFGHLFDTPLDWYQ